jgi:toluene monooxygenase system protein D
MGLLAVISGLSGGGRVKETPMSSKFSEGYKNNRVGPIIRAGDVAKAAAEAAEIDNPGKEITIQDRNAYLRIQCDDECVLTQKTMQEMLGRPFQMRELEVNLSSFAGNIEQSPDRVRFYFNKHV